MALKKNIFLTGAPSSGKTTAIKKIIAQLEYPAKGFFTLEERQGDKRVGFLMNTLDHKKGYLAHQDIQSEYRIRRYRVSIENIEAIAVPSIKPEDHHIIIMDEIGKMECFSVAFKTAALEALDSENIVVGTITFGGDDFILGVKNRDDIEIIEVTPGNRDALPSGILAKISALLQFE